jgi:hypothetical protein
VDLRPRKYNHTKYNYVISASEFILSTNITFFPPVALRPNAGHGLLILEVSRSQTTTHHSW